jgi:hypothetical protein
MPRRLTAPGRGRADTRPAAIELTHLGAAGWELTDIEREVEGLRPDVALIAAARQRLELHDYTGRLLRALGRPPLVFATHWDEQSLPFGASQDARLREADVFVNEVKAVAPRTRVIVSRHFERHTSHASPPRGGEVRPARRPVSVPAVRLREHAPRQHPHRGRAVAQARARSRGRAGCVGLASMIPARLVRSERSSRRDSRPPAPSRG